MVQDIADLDTERQVITTAHVASAKESGYAASATAAAESAATATAGATATGAATATAKSAAAAVKSAAAETALSATVTASAAAAARSVASRSAASAARIPVLGVRVRGRRGALSLILSAILIPAADPGEARRWTTEAEVSREAHVEAHRSGTIAEISRNDQITRARIRIEDTERSDDHARVSDRSKRRPVRQHQVAVVVPPRGDVEGPPRVYVYERIRANLERQSEGPAKIEPVTNIEARTSPLTRQVIWIRGRGAGTIGVATRVRVAIAAEPGHSRIETPHQRDPHLVPSR